MTGPLLAWADGPDSAVRSPVSSTWTTPERQVEHDGSMVTVTLAAWRWDRERLLTHVLTFGGSTP